MPRISNHQIFVLLLLTIIPLSFFVTHKIIALVMMNSGWIAILASIIPGMAMIYIYLYILKKSQHPFPVLLEEHLGTIAGRLLSLMYTLVFLLGAVIHLRLFARFMENNVIPSVPISVVIAAMLGVSFYALKKGIEVFARVFEIIFVFGSFLTFLMVIIGIMQNPSFENLKPIEIISVKGLFYSIAQCSWILGNMIIVLTLAFFSDDKNKIAPVLTKTLFFYIFFILCAHFLSIINLGSALTTTLSFPIYSITRSIVISDFIRNAEVVFVSTFIIGLFSSITVQWFMSCYILQQALRLKDFRFMLGPLALIIGFLTTQISPSLMVLFVIWEKVAPILFSIFYIGVPLLLVTLLMFKRKPEISSKQSSLSETANKN